METSFVNLDNARLDEQRQVMEKIVAAGHCPFCLENLRSYHHLPILRQGEFWIVTPSQWPYPHTRHHFLLIAKTHVEQISELMPEAGQDLFELIRWLQVTYQIPGGGFAIGMRLGDLDYSAGTVRHLHAQFVVPDLDDPDYEPVRFKVGSNRVSERRVR